MSFVTAEIPELQLCRPYLTVEHADSLLQWLIHEVDWHKDYYEAYGRRFSIPRLQAWFAEPGIQYSYSNNLLPVQPWSEPLSLLKQQVEESVKHHFNSVLVTYYRDGDDHVTWHADDEEELGSEPVIASVSLGADRRFCFRHRQSGEERELVLHSGDLLLMQPAFQHHWLHCVPKEEALTGPRINLTFRQVVNITT